MRCPACGNDETKGGNCSQCGTPIPSIDEKSTEPKPAPPKKPTTVPPGLRKEEKHRSRPFHDLDLTIPELDNPETNPFRKKPMQPKEESSFEVRDHRPKYDAGSVQPTPDPKPKADTAPPPTETHQEQRPPVDFVSFIFSLGASAMVAMGENPIPGSPTPKGSPSETPPANMSQAKELIDLIGMLQEKTKGNLTTQESELITQTLYTLRMKYVQATQKK